ncbi:DUF5994 family protein [Nocardia yamanashiensis]|uniref:DUF5994 family protein n=1 Tax=Nocardia yamanashiensis TaxID=209247 RepID=UPI00082EF283|nr:DUF5994 family protein [Nocardia yamanashiensis]
MTPTRLHHRHSTRIRLRPEYTPRLRLRPKGRPNAYIDGAWWPRSDNLAAELPDLLAVLGIRLGHVPRVVYDRASWPPAPRQITVNDRPVQLDAYRFELGNTMYIHGGTGEMIVLQVISSTTDDDTAHTALMAAVAPTPP